MPNDRPCAPLFRPFSVVLAAFLAATVPENAPAAPDRGESMKLPALNWKPRSDWLNAREAGAAGDGETDDTAVLQGLMNRARNGTVIYLPPGTYRITQEVRLQGPLIGVAVIGHGRDTVLLWGGEAGGRMFADDGVAYSRFVGLQFDGNRTAAIGFFHDSNRRFETEVRHQHLGFRNFTNAAVLANQKDKYALAETAFENCFFEDCSRGVVFTSFNDYNYTFDGCEFRNCGTGVFCSHGNFYVRNTHFEGSRDVDIWAKPEHGCSIRRTTSSGSKAFLRFDNSVSPMTIQDCAIAGWSDANGALQLQGAPVLLFDCTFHDGPDGVPPVRLNRRDQRLITSANHPAEADALIRKAQRAVIYSVPGGRRSGVIRSASQRFFRSEARIPSKVFDAERDFGAKADGNTDDSDAIQNAINAARSHADGAIAYLPTGTYAIGKTLVIEGENFSIGGTGFMTRLRWKGSVDGTMVTVRNVRDVSLEHIAIGNHDSGAMQNGIDILHTGSEGISRMTYDGVFVYGMYQKQPFRKGLVLRGLGTNDVVVMPHVQGNIRIDDCQDATVLANCSYEGSITVSASQPTRGAGFLGFMTRLATLVTHGLYLRDNQSIVMSDFYIEQAENGFVFEGLDGTPPGRVTVQGAKLHFSPGKGGEPTGTAMAIRNYAGEIFFGPNQFYVKPRDVRIRQSGDSPVDLFIWGNSFYKTALQVEAGEHLALRLLGNYGVDVTAADKVLSTENRAQDNLPPAQWARLAAALDDLRRLGEVDQLLNHPDSQ